MSYHMNAEGINGVNNPTVIVNIGLGSSADPPSLLMVDALQSAADQLDLAALQCRGSGKGAGVIGLTSVPFGGGLGGGVGVAGFSQMPLFGPPIPNQVETSFNGSFDLVVNEVAGVLGMCQAGPGVAGEGANAANPPNIPFSSTPVAAGFGASATGGNSCAASTVPNFGEPGGPQTFPALPSGAGLVAVAGDTGVPDQRFTTGTGVLGMGGGNTNGFPPGRGGVFGSCGKIEPSGDVLVSLGNVAQLQLLPTNNPPTVVPPLGRVGDLYATVAKGVVSMFLCISASHGQTHATWTQIQTSGSFTA